MKGEVEYIIQKTSLYQAKWHADVQLLSAMICSERKYPTKLDQKDHKGAFETFRTTHEILGDGWQ